MLHILLLILKIIGIILAIILGILLVVIGIVLFAPIRYEISAKCDGTIDSMKAKVKATWFRHLIRADIFLKGKILKWQLRVAWLKKSNQKKKEEKKDESKEIKPVKEHNEVEETAVKAEKSEKSAEISEEKCKTAEEKIKEDRLEESKKDINEKFETDSEGYKTSSKKSKKESVNVKIKKIIEKIKMSVKNICDKIKDLLQKKDKITEFLTNDAHIRAFRKAKKELYILLKKLKPKKINIKLRFGFEDPATTGKVLGGLSMLYPFLGETTEITPDFENQVLKGTVYLKGKIRFCHFAGVAIRLILCKDIRSSYRDIRNFKL